MSILNEAQKALFKSQYEAGIRQLEQHVADCQAQIATVEATIAELKQRADYAVGSGLKNEIAGYYNMLDGLNAAITNAQSKISDYRAAISQVDQDAAAEAAAISKTTSNLEGMVKQSTVSF